MKFRGIMRDITCINHFTKVVQAAAKLAKTCIVRFTTDKVYLVHIESNNRNRCHMWFELEQAHFFQDYMMTGVSEDHNEIYLEVSTENMSQALKLAQNAKMVTIKLTKRHGSSLTYEIELPSLTSGSRLLTHDVPVSLVQTVLWDDYQEPSMPNYNISFLLPSLQTFKSIVERMKHLGNCVAVSATRSGNFTLKVETETVTVTSTFNNLNTHINSASNDLHDSYETRVDIRKLAQFITCQQLSPTRIVCNIQTDRVVHFLLEQQGLLLQYFMPAISV